MSEPDAWKRYTRPFYRFYLVLATFLAGFVAYKFMLYFAEHNCAILCKTGEGDATVSWDQLLFVTLSVFIVNTGLAFPASLRYQNWFNPYVIAAVTAAAVGLAWALMPECPCTPTPLEPEVG